MKKSKKASARVTAANRHAAAAEASGSASRGEAIGSAAIESVARRQFQKTHAKAIQGHILARGQRQQAKRDAR